MATGDIDITAWQVPTEWGSLYYFETTGDVTGDLTEIFADMSGRAFQLYELDIYCESNSNIAILDGTGGKRWLRILDRVWEATDNKGVGGVFHYQNQWDGMRIIVRPGSICADTTSGFSIECGDGSVWGYIRGAWG